MPEHETPRMPRKSSSPKDESFVAALLPPVSLSLGTEKFVGNGGTGGNYVTKLAPERKFSSGERRTSTKGSSKIAKNIVSGR